MGPSRQAVLASDASTFTATHMPTERELWLDREAANARLLVWQLLMRCYRYVPTPVLQEWFRELQAQAPTWAPGYGYGSAAEATTIPETPRGSPMPVPPPPAGGADGCPPPARAADGDKASQNVCEEDAPPTRAKKPRLGPLWVSCSDGAERRFQYWGGRATKWQDYPADVQEVLKDLRAEGTGIHRYTYETTEYEIVIHPRGCAQTNPQKPWQKPRTVRVLMRHSGQETIEEFW